MSVLYILLPLALVIVAVAVGAFVWAARRGQFDDMETPAMRIVLDDDEVVAVGSERGTGASGSTGEDQTS
jgi:cbb3-type cytochrome oxidase maturation protein